MKIPVLTYILVRIARSIFMRTSIGQSKEKSSSIAKYNDTSSSDSSLSTNKPSG